MSRAVGVEALRDHDQYHVLVPDGVEPRYEDLRAWLSAPSEIDREGLRRLLLAFHAGYLVLRSANVDTLGIEDDFRAVRGTLRGAFADDDEFAWSELGEYAGPQSHAVVVETARQMLSALSHGEAAPSREQGYAAKPSIRSDPTIVAIPSRGQAYPVLFEHSFVDDMVTRWHLPSLVSTSHAVEALHLLNRRTRSRPFTPELALRGYVDAHYDECGAFRASYEARPSLYGTRSAIVIYKTAADILCDGTLDGKVRDGVLSRERRKQIIRFTIGHLDAILEGRIDGGERVTVIDVFHALYVLKNLAWATSHIDGTDPREAHPSDIRDRAQRIIAYLRRCFRGGAGNAAHGFALAPTAQERCLTACMFAHRIAHRIAQDYEIQDPELTGEIDECRRFAVEAWSEDGGFGSTSIAAADMVHTYIGLTLDSERGWDLEKEIGDVRSGVEAFLAHCNKGGGYALGAELKPSAYGTRLAVQVCDRLQLPVANPLDMDRFIGSLGSQADGYRGYHLERPG